ncbi:3-hydroxyacyl-CoA dehydrogenase family protein [Kitasatospora sp. NPDC002227]|uniref:3-hydroxyacyl-CoA dehydrogenase family protein n=1 Tax=Kitasatospora sp. NPDC002227 TaxID=3154773 RepID=UPI00331FD294
MTKPTVGVIGAGTIGRSVAHALAVTGHRVLLVDTAQEILDDALAKVRRELRFARLLGADAAQDDAGALARITPTVSLAPLAEADFVIENSTEDWEVKRAVYRELEAACRPGVVFAANTSCVPVAKLAAETARPELVLGMHFMNPVPHKPVVEVIRGALTADSTVERAEQLLAGMGKSGVLVNDSPGFVSNRVLMLAVNEAAFLVQEGVAGPAEVDRIFTSCFGHPMGMLATADLIGIDTVLLSIEMLEQSFADPKYRPCPLLKEMVAKGHLGKKSGQGFFSYA